MVQQTFAAEDAPKRSISANEKMMVLRAHVNLGHPRVREFVRLLKAAGTRNDIVDYVLKEFTCAGCAKEQRMPTRLPSATPRTYDFNIVVGIDLLFVHGASPLEEHPVLNVTRIGTLYSTFTMVDAHRRSSALVRATFLQAWLRVFGSPSFLILDQGLEFAGHFVEGLENLGIQPMLIDRNAPYQNGVTERRGGLFKELYYKTRELHQPSNLQEVKDMIHEVSWALQTLTNRSGYSPAQRVFGRQPSLALDLLGDGGQFELSQTGDEAWKRSEAIRQAARKALVEIDGKERLDRALRSRPRRAREDHTFEEGEPVYVWRQGKRGYQAKVGPCFVVLQKGDTVWITRRSELWKCNKSQIFKMGNMEKQGLESIPRDLLKVKERLRYDSEKLGHIDVTKEGDPRLDADGQPAQGDLDIHRRIPPTPRGPPEGLRTPVHSGAPQTPLPAAPLTPRPVAMREMRSRSPIRQPVIHVNDDDDRPGDLEKDDQPGTTSTQSQRPSTPRPETATPSQPMTPKAMPMPSAPSRPSPEVSSQSSSAPTQPMKDADELWKATVESQRFRDAGPSTTSDQDELRHWVRYDVEARRFRGSNSHGPLWGDVIRRITLNIDDNKIVADEEITPEMTVHKIHRKLPTGVRSIETTLVYRKREGHPDPGQPWPPPESVAAPSKKPELPLPPAEDARLIDEGMKRGLESPTSNPRATTKSKLFPVWHADDNTEWGNKTNYPIVANIRDLDLFYKLTTNDCFYGLQELSKPITYLTKQSGKELDEKKIPEHEKKMFNEAKLLEIQNLVNSNAIEIVTDPDECAKIRDQFPGRIMPSRYLVAKKTGDVAETWKAKARWILLGHKDPDALELERYAPTPSSTTVMVCLQIIASMRFQLRIMDVSSAFGQSDPHERSQGPLFTTMPPTGIPGYPQTAIIKVLTAVYGLVNAPAVWRKTVRRLLLDLGYTESVFDPCFYFLKALKSEIQDGSKFGVAGVVLLDVDDFCQGGGARHQELMSQLRTKLKFGKWRNVYGESADYIGRTLTQKESYEVQVSMKRYIENKLKPVTLPKDRLKQKESLLNEQETSWLRGVGGSLLWVGKEGRPDVGAACAMAMSWSSGGPTVEHITMANKTVAELKMTPEAVIRVLPISPERGLWMTIADASMANVENKSQGGFLIAYVDQDITDGKLADFSVNSWRSHRLKRVVKATLGSEALAMDDALAEVEWVRAMWHEALDPSSSVLDGTRLGDEQSLLVMRMPEDEEKAKSIHIQDKEFGIHVTDAKALFDLLNRRSGNAGQDRRAQIDVAVICVSAKAMNVKTYWVPGSVMVADALTKRLGNSVLLRRTMASAKYALVKQDHE